MTKAAGKEMQKAMLSTEQLRELDSFDGALAVLRDAGLLPENSVIRADDLGDGFSLLNDKDTLIGKPLMFITWVFSPGDFDNEFVSARVMVEVAKATKDRQAVYEKYIINDGGTGICAQLRDITDRKPEARMLFAPRGLRKSEYDNEHGHGTTHYIDTSAIPA